MRVLSVFGYGRVQGSVRPSHHIDDAAWFGRSLFATMANILKDTSLSHIRSLQHVVILKDSATVEQVLRVSSSQVIYRLDDGVVWYRR